ncbi:MAG: class I SAM-dependent methyltransferase [Paracoccaceae bacterium]|nr:class I SAM-dependent methyltransferase [Paracoccaceae bacterium]MDP5364863.1 class I SAM-dependent methyltransferase [Paracoccaceae bacterium]
MSRRLNLPDTASVAHPSDDGRMFAPSAARNAADIAALVAQHAPASGRALEIASGTGEHAVIFAGAMPGLDWQPTDIDPARRASVDAHAAMAGLANLRAAIPLDATASGWGAAHAGQDLIVLVNLLHLISEAEARTLIAEVAQALAPGGMFILYGPFLRDGETTSDGDRTFHASLRAQDPEIGYKDDWDVIDWIHANWLDLVQVVEMPANNMAFVARRPA